MPDRRFSAAELAAHAGIALPTLTFFVNRGILEPSVQRATGRGRGHVFNLADVLGAKSLNALRIPDASAAPLRQLVLFWHTPEGKKLTERLRARRGTKKPCVLLVTDGGVEVDIAPDTMMEKYRSQVVYCLDAASVVEELNIDATEALVRLEFVEPGPSGRVPPKRRTTGRKKNRGRDTAALADRPTKKNEKKRDKP